MNNRDVKRKLAAIVSTDVKDYSRLMADNEIETVKSIKVCRELLSQKIEEHQGRVVDSPGDNILSEFSSVTDAVECAVEIQKVLSKHNKDLPDDRKMEFRIGINLGDIIEDDQRIYGDGINIAARLEGLAQGGGICISGSAYDQVKNKLTLGYEYLGAKKLKNIAEPVPVYRVLTDPKLAGKMKYKCIKDNPRHKIYKRLTAAVVIILLITASAIFLKMNPSFAPPKHRQLIREKLMNLRLPDKPSIAVLPFMNMSGDAEQEYFSDGLTEDLITDLSKVSGLFVIARNSAFSYKGRNVKVDTIGRELGVKYVLEGSVRKMGDQVRINAQLIDTISTGHVWAERYDRDLKDIFTLQDEVREKIVTALSVQMTSDDKKRIMKKETTDLAAYDYLLKGNELCSSNDLKELEEGRAYIQKAIDQDPNFAKAYAVMGKSYFTQWIFGPDKDIAILNKVFEYAQKVIAINPEEPSGYSLLSHYYLWTKQHDSAIDEIRKALALNPNNPEWLASLGEQLVYSGKPEQGIEYLLKAIRLDPKYPVWYMWNLGHAYYLTGDYGQAIEVLEKAVAQDDSFWPSHLILAICYNFNGMKEESQKAVKKVLEQNKNLLNENWPNIVPYKNPDGIEKMNAALKQIGLYKQEDKANVNQ
ncbi:MAG: adenylate/guanylate cyclase domain-containing protein [Desulfobacteraceae bacterium]|nr:adenylate/guanylate cyclase domain-containing protein [Desulfobacteraceae bacterium]